MRIQLVRLPGIEAANNHNCTRRQTMIYCGSPVAKVPTITMAAKCQCRYLRYYLSLRSFVSSSMKVFMSLKLR